MEVDFFLAKTADGGAKQRETTSKVPLLHHVVPGEVITREAGFMRGHGTFVNDDKLVATVSGTVERVNKLISVRPLRQRYQGEIGDVVVGRVTSLGQKRWLVDVNHRLDAILLLSSINLPGGVQRRRTIEDELNMRNFFIEGDLISAEVQQFFAKDGAMSLHTRSARYGKLEYGELLTVPPSLIKRCKTAFHILPGTGVEAIIGMNGYIFLSPAPFAPSDPMSDIAAMDTDEAEQAELERRRREAIGPRGEISIEMRERLCRVRNAIVALAKSFIYIYPETIMDVYEDSLNLRPKDMLKPDELLRITQRARERKGELSV